MDNRHLELYDQMGKTSHIKGTNLIGKMKLPAIIWDNEKAVSNNTVFTTIKSNLNLKEGTHTLYINAGGKAIELGKANLDMNTIHAISSIAKFHNPSFTEIGDTGLERTIDDDVLVETIVLGI